MRRNMARPPYFMELMEDFERDIKIKTAKASEATHDKWIDDNDVTWWVHRWNQSCTDLGCAIHCPTDHHMSDWPKVMATGTLVVRLCEHDYEHPDPDSFAFFVSRGQSHMGVHNCCPSRCCRIKPKNVGGETSTVSATPYTARVHPVLAHNEWDCEDCNPYGLAREDIH
jgi:hypothetical protein